MTCSNPYCEDGWVKRADGVRGPCYVCRVHLPEPPKQNEDRYTSTVDGAAAHSRQMHRDLQGWYR